MKPALTQYYHCRISLTGLSKSHRVLPLIYRWLTRGYGNSILYLAAGANVFTDFSTGNVSGFLFGGVNAVTKQGDGNIDLAMYGGANVLTQVGKGNIKAMMFGGANIITKVGDGNILALLFGKAISCIDNMISYTNTLEDNITLTPPSALH
jgi:hypothetical protein